MADDHLAHLARLRLTDNLTSELRRFDPSATGGVPEFSAGEQGFVSADGKVTVLDPEEREALLREEFQGNGKRVVSETVGAVSKAERHPGFCLAILEACVDEVQRKVWVRSEIRGLPGGMVKESIDMLTFDEHGVPVSSVDEQKVRRRL